jgi:hypothetical protein
MATKITKSGEQNEMVDTVPISAILINVFGSVYDPESDGSGFPIRIRIRTESPVLKYGTECFLRKAGGFCSLESFMDALKKLFKFLAINLTF